MQRSTWVTESAKVLGANLWRNLDEYKLSRSQHAVTEKPAWVSSFGETNAGGPSLKGNTWNILKYPLIFWDAFLFKYPCEICKVVNLSWEDDLIWPRNPSPFFPKCPPGARCSRCLLSCPPWSGLDLVWRRASRALQGAFFQKWVVLSNVLYFHPYLGKWSNLTSIFFKWVETTT